MEQQQVKRVSYGVFDFVKVVVFLHIAIVVSLVMATPVIAAPSSHVHVIDSLLSEIDQAICHSTDYVKQKTDRIAILQDQLKSVKSLSSQYDISFQLYHEYLPFVNDSAIYYLERCVTLAHLMGDESRAGGCKSLIALSCSNAGLYVESESILKDIDAKKLHGTDLGLYYNAYGHVAGEIAYYSKMTSLRQKYTAIANDCRQKMMNNLPANHKYAQQCRETMLYGKGDFKHSLDANTKWLNGVKAGSTDYALVCFYRYLEYQALADSTQMMYWLAESVLSDVRNAVMDQGSMWEMANLLMARGDVDRSYRYICFTSDCADRFGSRQRLSRISPLLSHIAQCYKVEADHKNQQLVRTLAIISIMSLLLLLTLFYVYRKRNQLALMRDQLALSNEKLKESNLQLSTLNTQLIEANRVKEEYVGRFMRLCSVYIDRLDTLRKKVAKRVKNKQYAELATLTLSADFKQQEANELYANFDLAFLHLFPTFVEEFNALLKPEHRIVLTSPNTLNTTIRIFALIRLGINDSSKIAEFLHYSVNTIYNYRAGIKNGAVIDRTEFENEVKKIGAPKESDTEL